MSEALVQLSPSDLITISTQKKEGALVITNKSHSPVAFKVQTSSPKVFLVNPSNGLILGSSSLSIKITLNNVEEATTKPHKFLIKAKSSSDGNVDWKSPDIQDFKIPAKVISEESIEEAKSEKLEVPENPNRFKSDLFKTGIVKNFIADYNKEENLRKTTTESRPSDLFSDKPEKSSPGKYEELRLVVENLKGELEKLKNKQKFAIELERLTIKSEGKYTLVHVFLGFLVAFFLGHFLTN